ncbi:MAG: hypothetical protein WCK78_09720 [Paludibacter sp.]
MINRTLTDLYLNYFDSLNETLYFCWHNSYCKTTNLLDQAIFNNQIRSYGFYNHKNAIRNELPLNLKNRLEFKTLYWVNKYVKHVEENSLCEYIELFEQVISEIENNLFLLNNKADKIAYANIILRDLNKNSIHNQCVCDSNCQLNYKELFVFVLNVKFKFDNIISPLDIENCKNHVSYDLTNRLINHFDFIERLIELFLCFEICLVKLAEKVECNLYTLNDNKFPVSDIDNLQPNISPKFNTLYLDDCLIKVMQYLSNKKWLRNPNADVWLFWFNQKNLIIPEPLKWYGSATMLSNVIQHLCGESISSTINVAFDRFDYVKPTRKIYETSKTHKEIEQIITVSKQNK